MKEYELEVFDNPISNNLPSMHFIKCKIAPGIAIGSGIDNRQREASAIGEAFEWDVMFELTEDITQTYDESNSKMISPALFGHSFDNIHEVDWVEAENSGLCFFVHRPTRTKHNHKFYNHTSNGIAVHSSRQQCITSALNEIIERTFIGLFWTAKINIEEISSTYEDDYTKIIQDEGWGISYYQLCNTPYVIMAIIFNVRNQSYNHGAVITGYKCSENIEHACCGALYEAIQVLEALYLGKGERYLSHEQRHFINNEGISAFNSKLKLAQSIDNISSISIRNDDIYYRIRDMKEFYYCECFVTNLPSYYYKQKKESPEIWPL
ncbi:YcaO-like family protein [Aeromonas hydrophila]|uniref:YcaO-like family protein n=1 Tax=Aeromonas hydrophila TaxID=644 RepID=UPI002B459C53|nr:YcaO-like family protein [Aeromonas hydrophila]